MSEELHSITITPSAPVGGPVSTAGPFGGGGTLTLTGHNDHERMSIEDVRMFKDMCGLLRYIAEVDPKFKEYVQAYEAKKRILK